MKGYNCRTLNRRDIFGEKIWKDRVVDHEGIYGRSFTHVVW